MLVHEYEKMQDVQERAERQRAVEAAEHEIAAGKLVQGPGSRRVTRGHTAVGRRVHHAKRTALHGRGWDPVAVEAQASGDYPGPGGFGILGNA